MPKICLFADDGKTAEILISKVVNQSQIQNYVGIALYPEALSVFEEYGLQSVILDDYITRSEHEENGIEASNFIFNLNKKLGLNPQSNHSFNFENFDLLYSYHFVNYHIFANIFYLYTVLTNVFEEIKPEKVYAVDLRKPLKLPLAQRPRSLFTKALLNVCGAEKLAIELIKHDDSSSDDSISGLDVSHYKFVNNTVILKIPEIFERGFCNEGILKRVVRLLPEKKKIDFINDKPNQAILYVGMKKYFDKIIKEFSSTSIISICLDSDKSQRSIFYKNNSLIMINLKCLTDNFMCEEFKDFIAEYNARIKKLFDSIENDNTIKRNLCYREIGFTNIFLQYLKLYVESGFSENLKIFLAMGNYARMYNIRFALGYCGWTLPETFSIHEALKKNNVHTAYLSHGLNVVNKEIAHIVRGDGTLLPCDILFSPGQEFLNGHVENRLKDKTNNFVTGFPYYRKAKRIEAPYKKFFLKKMLSLNPEKKIVLYPLTLGAPLVPRANMTTFSEEYNFIKNTIEVFKEYNQFQFVVKSKHYTIPDKNYLKLFHDNFPNVLLRYGKLNYYLSVTDVVINFLSSSGFDALLAKVPVIYFKPNNRHDWFENYVSRNGVPNFFLNAENYEDIPTLCNEIINGKFPEWYHDKMREVPSKFLVAEGKVAAENIASIIRNNLQ